MAASLTDRRDELRGNDHEPANLAAIQTIFPRYSAGYFSSNRLTRTMEGGVFQAIRTVASGRIRLALALLVLAPSVVAATAGSQIIRAQDMAPGTPAEGHVIASSRGGTSGALVRGIASADIAKLMPGTNQTASQSFSDFNDGRAVIIGHALADRQSLRAGGNITLVAPHGMTTAAGSGPPLMKTYTDAAVVPADSAPYDSAIIFTAIAEVRSYGNR